MEKFICIKSCIYYSDLTSTYSFIPGNFYYGKYGMCGIGDTENDNHFYGVLIEDNMIIPPQSRQQNPNGIVFLIKNKEGYDEFKLVIPLFDEYFITVTEYREQKIKKILN